MLPLANGQSGQQQSNEKKGDPVSAIYALSVIHSNCIIVFLRTGFGREALGMRGPLSLVLLLLCLGAEPRMIWWVAAFLVAIVIHRISTCRATRNGAVVHSLYAGNPLLIKSPLARNVRDAMRLELVVCFLVGMLLLPVSHFMGVFMMLGFVTLGIRAGIEESVYDRRLMRMQDAQIEGRWYGNRMRR